MSQKFSEEVSKALDEQQPVVALESTVIAHGIPFPQNLETALRLEDLVRENGAIPATTAIFDGEICLGLSREQIERLAKEKTFRKLSIRDLPIALAGKYSGATTVATASFIAHRAGIKVFATGGIGGVHRGDANDISADLPVLASTPIVTVCAGAKSILDLPATREWLETHGIPVLGWRCDEFPAFYSTKSGLAVDERIEIAEEVFRIAKSRDDLRLQQAILIAVPVPAEFAIAATEFESILTIALKLADEKNIRGKELTPFLLSQLSQKSEGKTLRANIALLENNVRVAAEIAVAMTKENSKTEI